MPCQSQCSNLQEKISHCSRLIKRILRCNLKKLENTGRREWGEVTGRLQSRMMLILSGYG